MKTETVTVRCSGIVGEVYTTWNGNEPADPYVHAYGWRQVSPLIRESVESYDVVQTHDRWLDWFNAVELKAKIKS
ncbi:MAG: hypothetical protein WC761_05825 [Candidatus Paceibacterota bacterium]|jgi:hypothetical protein